MASLLTLIDDGVPHGVDAVVHDDGVRLSPAALERALGWKLEPQGLCRAGTCVPVRERAALLREDGIDLAVLARLLDRPLAMEPVLGVAVLGTAAAERAGRLAAMDAPDFTIPDLEGRLHSLRDHRGKKRLLIAWASW